MDRIFFGSGGGGWTVSRTSSICTRSAALAALFLAGTCTSSVVNQPRDFGVNSKESRYASDWKRKNETAADDSSALSTLSVGEELDRINEILKSSTTELASLLGVSRQTIYNWRAGEPISHENESRLKDILAGVEIVADAGLAGQRRTLRRKLPGGSTLFEVIQNGGSVKDGAQQLVVLLTKEAGQRDALVKRLGKRKHSPMDLAEIGLPFFNEHT